MRRLLPLLVSLILTATSCLPAAGSSGSCLDYVAEVRALLDSRASASEIQAFLDLTEERAARLIVNSSPEEAQACAEVLFEAMFTAADRGFAEQFDD